MKDKNSPYILITDDSLINRTLLIKILDKDYNILEAKDGVEALEILDKRDDISLVLLDIKMPRLDGFGVMKKMQSDKRLKNIAIVIETANNDENIQVEALKMGASDFIVKPFNSMIVFHRIKGLLEKRESMIQNARSKVFEELFYKSEIDEKTGLYNKLAFNRRTKEMLTINPTKKFVIVYADMDRFKVFNDTFGVKAGDKLLMHIGDEIKKNECQYSVLGHWNADHFVACLDRKDFNPEDVVSFMTKSITINQEFEYVVRIGIFEIDDPSIEVSLMCDRAQLALKTVKNDYTKRIAFYEKSMRTNLLKEQEILNEMETALKGNQFTVYFQPQYNYNTKTLHGAEALVRWIHPEKGLISPGDFVPIFESNGFITKLDEFVWNKVCSLQREWLDKGMNVVPVSINISRRDIYNPKLCEHIFSLVKKYNLPPKLIRLEITESAYMDNPNQLIRVVESLRAGGFEVEMDDFGSGYSSLNTLKTVPVDLLKLDMKFLEDNEKSSKGGTILTSVIRMAHWINIPVLAEGVETVSQAEYLKSVGCYFIQGYLLARPMPIDSYKEVLENSHITDKEDDSVKSNTQIATEFLSDSSQATMLFNSYVGGAAIVEFGGDELEIIRLNDKFFDVLNTTRDEYNNEGKKNSFDRFVPESRKQLIQLLKKAVDTGKEVNGDFCSYPLKGKKNYIWTNVHAKLLAKTTNRSILYLSFENISNRIKIESDLTAIINSVPGGILRVVISDKVETKFANDVIPKMFGFEIDEYRQRFAEGTLDAIYPEDRKLLEEKIKEIVSGKITSVKLYYRHACKDGNWMHVCLIANVSKKEDKVITVTCILMNNENEFQMNLKSQELEKKLVYEKTWAAEKNRLIVETSDMISFDYSPEEDKMTMTFPDKDKGCYSTVLEDYKKNFPNSNRVGEKTRQIFFETLNKASEQPSSGTFDFQGNYFSDELK